MNKSKEKLNEPVKKHYVLGCCGIDCGLCPRFYTEGKSKCPGCFGPNFSNCHPPCSLSNCCFKKNNLEVCGLCDNFPCNRYENQDKVLKDSFVTHKKIYQNHYFIKEHGLNEFIKQQKIRIKLLKYLLEKYNDKRSKNYYCLATTLLSIDNINNILNIIKQNKEINIEMLKNKINEYAKEENIELKLNK
jgi:hypothetical protein